ncbi:hypothetical protein D9619_002849 [Psilocybe cf. subviscida]|uniref:Deoxycytidylate deaminase n=1 Tax=Psilocybe cf. subviscida TaxID=2480587 RepID=A0A8H5AVP5_9AGAR|nr:hypothetical protein D9619_002849 [Psilocybe cf. subviscida]
MPIRRSKLRPVVFTLFSSLSQCLRRIAMFVAIVGTRFSGKSSIEDYLVTSKGFTSVRIIQSTSNDLGDFEEMLEVRSQRSEFSSNRVNTSLPLLKTDTTTISKHLSFLSMSPLPSPGPMSMLRTPQTLCFSDSLELLKFSTENWRENFVTSDLYTRDLITPFIRRPFFLLVSCDAPLLDRYSRAKSVINVSLEEFIADDDCVVFGTGSPASRTNSLRNLSELVNIQITNSFESMRDFHAHLNEIDLLHPEHLRPGWDAYFMTLASLASRRSNCMKRRVGAIIVRENRVLASGYNGTPRGLKNCNEGGCDHCNGTQGKTTECVCLHAEENALLEAGRERMGKDAVLYCNTCPCLKCTVKIIQTGVKIVVYNLTYKVDDASAALFREAGVVLRRYDPNTRFRLTPTEDDGLLLDPPKLDRQTNTSP